MASIAGDIDMAPRARPAWRSDALVLLAIVATALVARLPWFGFPIAGYDEQLYSLIGQAITQGALPFVDVWDRKPIGLFALFAAAHALGGSGPEAYQALALLFTVGGGWLTAVLARPLVDRATAAGSGMLYVLLMSVYGSASGQSEAFHVPLMLAMAVLVSDPAHPNAIRRALVAMLIGGLALQVKYTVAPQCAMFGLWALWGQYRRGASKARLVVLGAAFLALGLLPTTLVALYYALAGHWDGFFFANFLSFFDRAPSGAGRLHKDLLVGLVPLAVLAGGGLYAATRLTPPRDSPHYAYIALWFVACLATAFLPGTVYRYYFAALVPASVLLALPLLDRTGPARWGPLALVVAGAFALVGPLSLLDEVRQRAADYDRFAATVAQSSENSDACIFVFDGPSSLYRLADSCLPSRFVYPDHLNNALERDALGISQEGEVARILATRPPVIVTADTPLTPQNEEAKALVLGYIDRNYSELAEIEIGDRTIRAWELRR
ncbi:glycosyltransferase family 39 protein [Qipengyuania sp. G39]|uniref:Glycosyltransferase family 39 protein n=1 Tax=Qipengyuania profundimaris TaxID=3067652 RepID=A0ABT9HT14_9SPHN|nr:glycosyltransferase family 39 protein [Qipengyuania sp. G39]MDP4575808.1 glycosyltransferase family 39 protein [Qipengyuania sp. G39]